MLDFRLKKTFHIIAINFEFKNVYYVITSTYVMSLIQHIMFINIYFHSTGQRWKEMRPVLSPSFTTSKMKQMFVLMEEVAETFVDHFKNTKTDGTLEIEMKDAFTRFGNDIIASAAFGIQVNSLKEEKNQFYLMGKEATDFSGLFKTLKFFGYTLFPKLYEVSRTDFYNYY